MRRAAVIVGACLSVGVWWGISPTVFMAPTAAPSFAPTDSAPTNSAPTDSAPTDSAPTDSATTGAGATGAAPPTTTPDTTIPDAATPSATAPDAATPNAATPNAGTVCMSVQEAINNGLQTFGNLMDETKVKASNGDLVGAQASVRRAGATLGAIASQLWADAHDAADPRLQQSIADLAAEFARLGGQLKDITGLQSFDTTRLQALADAVADACGASSGPSPAPSASSGERPTPTPGRTGAHSPTFTA